MASTAEELLVIARLRNEMSRPIAQIRAEQKALKAEISSAGTATVQQTRDMKALEREYRSATKTSNALGNKLKSVGSTMTRDFTLPIIAGFALATKAELNNQKSQAVLDHTIRRTTGATKLQVQQTESWIRKTQLATGVSDNDLRPALGKLVMAHFGVAGSQRMLNLAMDVSVARNKDLSSVVEALAKAHVGNSTALKRLGVATTDATGRALTFDQIVARLAQTTGGSMATAANTAEGRIARFRQGVRVLGEDLGKDTLPLLDKGVKMLDGFVGAIDKLGPAGQDFVLIGGLALAAVGPIVRLAGSFITLGNAYAAWQAKRAAGAVGGDIVAASGGAATASGGGGIGLGGMVAPLALLTLGATIESAIAADAHKKSASFAAKLAGAGAMPGASQSQRLTSIGKLNAQINDGRGRRGGIGPGGGSSPFDLAAAMLGFTPKKDQHLGDLEKQRSKIQAAYRAEKSNVAALTSALGLNERAVHRLADANGVDLTGKLSDVTRAMLDAAQASKTNGQAITDQETAYKALSDSITAVQSAQARLLDPFLSFKQQQLSFLDAKDAYRKARTPRDRQAAEIALVQSGSSLINAGSQAGEYGPNGLSPVQAAANLKALLGPTIAGGDPEILRFVDSYYKRAAAEDPTGAKALAQQVNTFNITQNFGANTDPKKVKDAAREGFDAAARAAAHRDELIAQYYPRPTAGRF